MYLVARRVSSLPPDISGPRRPGKRGGVGHYTEKKLTAINKILIFAIMFSSIKGFVRFV